tara:strand:- start:40 stop:420 length:381 start_codon:yes stop_codon:yes gene_type:complete
MTYYAKIENGMVMQVIVAEQDVIDTMTDGQWVQTSRNTRGGIHYAQTLQPGGKYGNEPDGGIPLRKNYAGIGYTYDEGRDAFIPPKPYDSWVLDEPTCTWESPVPYPNDDNMYDWNEETQAWDLVD